MGIELLIWVLIVVLVVAVICYAISLIPGIPAWLQRIVQLMAFLIGLLIVLQRLGYT